MPGSHRTSLTLSPLRCVTPKGKCCCRARAVIGQQITLDTTLHLVRPDYLCARARYRLHLLTSRRPVLVLPSEEECGRDLLVKTEAVFYHAPEAADMRNTRYLVEELARFT